MNEAIESFVIERKYEVTVGAVWPTPAQFADLGVRLGATERHELHASYFDTPTGDLAAQRVAVRRRVGGKDSGWHLKHKGEEGARELLWPQSDDMPEGLQRELEHRIGATAVTAIGPIATLQTVRLTAVLYDESDAALVELADDRVDARNELTGGKQQWREWEAELLPPSDAAVLDEIEPLLVAAGATRVRGTSKIQRTMAGQ